MIEVIKPGATVSFKGTHGEVLGQVVNIQIGAALNVLYLVTWWDGRVRYEHWLAAIEIEAAPEVKRVHVGFKP